MTRCLFTAFLTSIQLPCSVSCYVAACFLRVFLSFWLYLSWPHAFRKKINRIHKRELSGVPKETSPIFDPHTSTSIILSRRGKSYRYFIQKIGKKNKNKNNTICKAICVNTQPQKLPKIFQGACILITFIETEHFLNQFQG